MITADQIVAHAVGDYVLQSDWMAADKTKKSLAALAHVATYGLPFLVLRPSLPALAFIVATHFIIDRWRLARYIVWAKNMLAPRSWWKPWAECTGTGYPADKAPFMAVWLLIFADNTLHLICNGLAMRLWP
jgi:hypothetical protein